MKEIECAKCHGVGTVPDSLKVGPQLRALREKSGLSLRRMAALLEISPSHLVDLEHGRRNWTRERELAFCEHCNAAMKKGKA